MTKLKDSLFNIVWFSSYVLTGMLSGAGFCYLVAAFIYYYVLGFGEATSGQEYETGNLIFWTALGLGSIGGVLLEALTALINLKGCGVLKLGRALII